jgi:hypothetical protein
LQIFFNVGIVATKCGNAKRAKRKLKQEREESKKERKKPTNSFPHAKVAIAQLPCISLTFAPWI